MNEREAVPAALEGLLSEVRDQQQELLALRSAWVLLALQLPARRQVALADDLAQMATTLPHPVWQQQHQAHASVLRRAAGLPTAAGRRSRRPAAQSPRPAGAEV